MSKTVVISKQALFLALFFICSNVINGINFFGIPVTFQTMIIFLVPFFFTLKDSLVWYVALLTLSVLGLPLMANFQSGVMLLVGPTSGFIYGWLIEIVVISLAYQKVSNVFLRTLLVTCSIILALACGGISLSFYNELGLLQNVIACVLAFLPVELVKMVIVKQLIVRLAQTYLNKEMNYGL